MGHSNSKYLCNYHCKSSVTQRTWGFRLKGTLALLSAEESLKVNPEHLIRFPCPDLSISIPNETAVLYIQMRVFSFNFHCLSDLLLWVFLCAFWLETLVRCCHCNGDSCICGFSPSLSPWALLPLPPDGRAVVRLHLCLPGKRADSQRGRLLQRVGWGLLPSRLLPFIQGRRSVAASGYLESVCTCRNNPLQAQIIGFQN